MSHSIKRQLTALLSSFIVVTVSQQEGGTALAADIPTTIRIAFSGTGIGGRPQIGGSYIATAHARGMLEEEFRKDNIQIQWHFFKGAGPATNEAFANHQIDFGAQGDLPSTVGKAAGLKTKILLSGGARWPYYVAAIPDLPITSVADLKDKKVAIFKGTAYQLVAARVLATHGLSERDLKVYNMDIGTANAALAHQDIDALFGSLDIFPLRDQGLAKIVYSIKGQEEKLSMTTSLLATEEFTAKYPEITKRVVKVMVQAAQWSSDEANREQLFLLWEKSGIPAAHYRESFEGQPLKLRNSPLMDPFFVTKYKQAGEDCRRYGLLRTTVDVDQWIDRSYLEAALKELKLEGFWQTYDADGKPIQK
jgi:sulfonate transport system substrate-binding protein